MLLSASFQNNFKRLHAAISSPILLETSALLSKVSVGRVPYGYKLALSRAGGQNLKIDCLRFVARFAHLQ